ncbi:MAG: N-acetylmuramoyl-L-alanine amidase, partial [Cytophagaceae bacterium]
MLHKQLAAREASIRQTGLSGTYTLKPFSVKVLNEELVLNTVFCTPPKRSGYYHNIEHAKERIVLHFTAGQLSGDLDSLTKQDYRVSVPFVIARDGTIYQLYLSKFWSGNLGPGAVGNKGTNNAQDKCTIGIELSNYGPLHEKDGVLYTVYDSPYCTLADKTAYQKLSKPFRGESYFATFTDAQYNSLTVLLRYLTSQYQIPRKFVAEPGRYESFEGVTSFKG